MNTKHTPDFALYPYQKNLLEVLCKAHDEGRNIALLPNISRGKSWIKSSGTQKQDIEGKKIECVIIDELY